MTNIARNTGRDIEGIAALRPTTFMECRGCGEWFDMRDLGQVFQDVHEGEIDSDEALEPQRPGRREP
jgi:CRISPR/Cas system type I-B associated protein Csh2 (Cas7 group RAMP superfamily)